MQAARHRRQHPGSRPCFRVDCGSRIERGAKIKLPTASHFSERMRAYDIRLMKDIKTSSAAARNRRPRLLAAEIVRVVGPCSPIESAVFLSKGDKFVAADMALERRRDADRRGTAWRAFLYGNFRPRRRQSRRETDAHLFLFDWHEPRVLFLALGVLLLSCTDALFTLNLLNLGATEANFVMASVLERSVEWFLASKISLTAVSLVCLVAVARRKFFRCYNVEHLLQLFFVAYLLVICYEFYLFKYVFGLNIFLLF